jgi:hypothetical protein
MKNSIENFTLMIEDVNKMISILLEQSDAEKRKDIEGIRNDIANLRNLLQSKDSGGSLGFSKIRIRFDEEYELKLPKYGIETFNRTLKDEMYFSVIGGSDEFMDIKTKSFPDTFRIRLTYQTLESYKRQIGDAYLIYNRGTEKLEGEEIKVKYKIISKS